MHLQKSILTILLFLGIITISEAQEGTIKGSIITKDGKAAEAVSVFLKDTKYHSITDTQGHYEFVHVPEGKYLLISSMVGLKPLSKKIDLRKAETVVVDLILSENETELQEVTVLSRKTMNERQPTLGKAGIASRDLPQSVTVIDRVILEKQQVQNMGDVLKNANGVYVMGTTGGTQVEIAGRGYAYGSSNTFKNGVRYNNGVLPEMSSLEKVEILKGSNAILYGNVAAGGVLNLVTRKPKFEKGGELLFTAGSYDFYKPSLDIYGPLNNSSQLAFRINTAYEKANSYRDVVHSERFYINPSFLYQPSDKTSVLLEMDYVADDRTSDYGTGAIDYVIANVPRNRFLGAAWSYNKANQQTITLTSTHRFNNNWQLKNTSNYSRYTVDLFGTTRPNASGNMIQANGNWVRGVQRSQTDEQYWITQLDLTGKFSTGNISHQLLLGADADKYQTVSTGYNSIRTYDTLNIFDAGKFTARNDIPDPDKNTLTTSPVTRFGLYAQDLVSLKENLKLLAGIRYTQQHTRSEVYSYSSRTTSVTASQDGAFTPRLGLVYQPSPAISLFVSYANSFSLNKGIDTNGNTLPPSYLNQYEAGIKTDLFHKLISANLTVYRIVNSNLAQSLFPANAQYPNAQELAGEVTSKGLEIDIMTKPYQGLSAIAGYSFNDTRYTKSNTYIEGSRLRYNPQHTANLSLFYNCSDQSRFRGVNFGVTAFYTGMRVAGRSTQVNSNNDTRKLMQVPDYTQMDFTVGYTKQNLSIRLKCANLFNVLSYYIHDDNSVNPIAPRQITATIGCKL